MPGGWADVNESPSQAIEREIFEESGYQTKAVKLLALYDNFAMIILLIYLILSKLFFSVKLLVAVPLLVLKPVKLAFFQEKIFLLCPYIGSSSTN